jgi:hypothetical protein
LSIANRRDDSMQLRLTLRALAAALVYALILWSVSAQDGQSAKPIIVGGNQGVDGSNCDTTKAAFDHIAQTAGDEETIIAIGRLGRGELSRELIRRRLRNLEEFIYFTRGMSKDRVVKAEGERVDGLGHVEVYIKGKLFMIFRMKRNKDFLTNCEP